MIPLVMTPQDLQAIGLLLSWHARCGPDCCLGMHRDTMLMGRTLADGGSLYDIPAATMRDYLIAYGQRTFRIGITEYTVGGEVEPPQGKRFLAQWSHRDPGPQEIAAAALPTLVTIDVRFTTRWPLAALRQIFAIGGQP